MSQNLPDPQDDLDNALRRLARETHPRREFSARLRRELSTQQSRPSTGPGLLAGGLLSRLRAALYGLRPWLGQGLVVVLMVGLVLLSGALAGRLLDPGSGGRPGQPAIVDLTGTPIPGQPIAGDLPAGALARLGKGQIRSLDVAADGRLAVGSSAGVCLYNTGMTISWCRWTSAPVAGALFSPAGDLLAVRYVNLPHVEVWDTAAGEVRASHAFAATAQSFRLPGQNEIFNATGPGIAWEPAAAVAAGASTDARLAVTSLGAELALWDWSADTLAWGPVTLPADALDVAWAAGPNDESLLAVLTQHSIDLYDGQTGQIKSMATTPANATEQNRSALIAMSLAPNGQQIAIDSAQGIETMALAGWQFIEGQRLTIPYHGERLAFSPDSRQLAVVSDDQVMILNSSTTSSAPSFSARPLSPLAWSAVENGVFYAAPDGSLAAISGENQRLIPTGHIAQLQHITWTADQTLTVGGGRYLYGWNPASTELNTITELTLPASVDLAGFSADAQRAGYLDLPNRSVALWDIPQNQAIPGIRAENGLLAAAIAPDGQHMAAVETGGLIFILRIESNAVDQHDLSGIRDLTQVNGLAFQPNGELLAVAYTTAAGPGLDLWHTTRDEKAVSLPVDGPVNGLAWSPDGSRLAVLQDFQILVFDAASFDLLLTLQPDPADMLRSDIQPWPFSALAFSPDGASLAAAARKLTVYDLASGQITREFDGQPQPAVDLAYRPDGQALASASQDGTILIWDLGAGPTAPVEPQPTATPLPVTSETPTSATLPVTPEPSQSPAAVDLTNYDVSMHMSQSPSGAWTIQALHGEFTERAPRPEDYNQFTVYGTDFNQKWRFEEWPAHGPGEGRPDRFTWSADERYFYIDDRVATDNCAGVAYQNLRRIDLSTGQIESVLPYGPGMSGVYSLSPDGERLAGVASAHIEIHNLTAGQPEGKLFLERPTTDTRSYDATAPVWSPDGTRLAVVLFEPYPLCQQANAETTLALIELANGDSRQLDFPPDARLTGWRDANTLTLVDSQGFERLLSLESGQVISEPLQEEARQALADAITTANDGGSRTLRWMSVPEIIRDQPGAERLRVWAEFSAQDGSLLSENDEPRSNFILQRLADGHLHVLDPLPSGPGGYTPRPYAAHLTSAEVQGLDETGVLRALVEEWLQTWRSPHASWRRRLLYYDVLEIRPAASRSTAEQVSQLPASVVYSVQPAQMMYSDWVAGNGQIGDGWIRQKALFIRAVSTDETVHLELIGTGP